jgi:type IV pilus assembly protein PilM
LDIGAHSIKAVVGKLDKDKLVLDNAFIIPMPEDLYKDGQFYDGQKVKDILEETLHMNKVRTRAAICTLESSTIITREVVLPSAKPHELKEMVGYEIQQFLPIELDQYIIQYKQLDEFMEGDTKHVNLLVAALPRGIAESYLNLLETLHLKPIALDVHSNAITKLIHPQSEVNHGDTVAGKTSAIVDLGHNQINVSIFDNGNFKFNRLLNIGGKDIDHNLANFLDFSLEEARIKKVECSDISKSFGEYNDESRFLNIIKSSVDTWIDEIERIFKYHMTRNTGNRLDVIYLYGGSANLNGIAGYMEEAFNIPVKKIKTISSVNTDNIKGNIDLGLYANALGAMVRR